MKNIKIYFVISIIAMLLSSCNNRQETQTLHVIHAGSLTHPVHKISKAFEEENPGIKVLSEAWGSKAGARRIIELDNPADVFLSADYMVIENMLIPEHADWYINFASNEMSIVYTNKSKYSDQITTDNWYKVLLKEDVSMGRSNPEHDPCGVRAVFTCQLAEKYYNEDELSTALLSKDTKNIRPKETDLIAMLESGHIDYIFLYRSVAEQHKLEYITLPDSVNLGNPELDDWYSNANTITLGSAPGETIKEIGQSMIYGLTIPNKTQNPSLAEKFVKFVLEKEKGLKILEESGQAGIVPAYTSHYDRLPEGLKKYAVE
ncbi:MAG: extracellular solute-binding protein [Bacteroidota bacterium]